MTVSPLPLRGGVQPDSRDDRRALRVSAHPDSDSVILSMWRGDQCVASHHIASRDVPDLIRILASTLIESTPEQRRIGA